LLPSLLSPSFPPFSPASLPWPHYFLFLLLSVVSGLFPPSSWLSQFLLLPCLQRLPLPTGSSTTLITSMDPSAARTCATCCAQRLLSEPAFQLCAGCRKVAYCSRGCQRAGWAAHKPRCASQNLLRAHYSEDGLTLTFTLKDVRPKKSDHFRPLTDRYASSSSPSSSSPNPAARISGVPIWQSMRQTTDSIRPNSSRSGCDRRKVVAATGRMRSVGGLRLKRSPGTSKLLLSSRYVTYRPFSLSP